MSVAVVLRARLSDAAEIAKIQLLGWREGFAELLPAEYLAGRVVEEEAWRARVSAPHPHAVLVAKIAGAPEEATLGGFAAVGPALEPAPVEHRIGQLYSIYVKPEFWGTGVGYILHASAMNALHEAGFSEAVLWHLEGNARARSFYLRQGWQETPITRIEDLEGATAQERLLRLHDLPARGLRRHSG